MFCTKTFNVVEKPLRMQLEGIKIPLPPTNCWVHPKAGMIPGDCGPIVITMQQLLLSGSDIFSPIYEMHSVDGGNSWSEPKLNDSLGRRSEDNGEVGICDFTPAWHEKTGRLLGTGHTVRYLGERLLPAPRPRETAYSVFDRENYVWSSWEIVEMPKESKFFSSGAGCTQRVDLPNGDILIPIYFHDGHCPYRSFTVMRCAFDGEKLTYSEHGSEHVLNKERGFLEPSLVEFEQRFYITLRAGDGRGYVSVSCDGLSFKEPQPWLWDDGTELVTGDTQQHWVKHRGELWLAYTRVTEDNSHVFRHRAPLFLAKVDPKGPFLLRDTEQVLVPQRGARLGNFQVTKISAQETWITVSEWMQPVGCQVSGSDNTIFIAKLL